MTTKSQLEFTADASGIKTGVEQGKRSLADLANAAVTEGRKAAAGVDAIGESSQAAAAKVDASTKNLIGSIQRATAAAEAGKKSGTAFYESLAQQRGVSVDVLRPYLDQLDAATAKTQAVAKATADLSRITTSLGATSFSKPLGNPTTSLGASSFGGIEAEAAKAGAAGTKALDSIGVSAKQTAAAMRLVPAQLTDIVVGLQGGQAPLTVLLQQGGQLKDMFGGIGPAARALGTYIGNLVNPFTLAAAAVGVLALAYYQASERTNAFNKALINTGNYVGQSAAQLDDLSQKIAKTVGTQGQAADALTALASSGKVAGDQLQSVGTAIVAQNKAMGTSVKDLVEQYTSLADDPVKASEKLNNSLHYLNQATYERIRALAEQGDKEGAAALAQDTLATAMVNRSQQVIQQTGLLSKALSGTRDVALGMWNAISGALSAVGAQQSAADKLVDAQRKVAFLTQNGSTPQALASAQGDVRSLSREALRQQDAAYAEGQRARDEAAKISASDRIKTLSDEVKTNADKRKKAIADLDRDFKLLGKATTGADYDKFVANINEKYKDPKEAKGAAQKAFQDDAATKMLEALRQTEASLKNQLDGESKITDAQKKQVEFQQLIADLKDKKVLTAEQKSLLANQDAIKAQLAKNTALANQIEYEKKIAEIVKKSSQDAAEFARQMEAINISISAGQQSRNEQSDRSLSAFGLGDRARSEVEAQKSIRGEFQRYLTTATKEAADKDQLGSKEYQDQVVRIKAALDDALKAQNEYFDALKSKEADWRNGATTAFANYIDKLNDVAKRTEELVTTGLDGFSDSLAKAIMGDKGASFKDLGKSIAQQLLKGLIETQITKPIAQWLQGSISGAGGSSGASSLLGIIFGSIGKSGGNAGFGSGSAFGNQDLGQNFAFGGYTGPGGKYDPAGIVHAGEYVMTAESTKSLGVDFLDRLNKRGYANGGYVGAVMGGNLRAPERAPRAVGPAVSQYITVGDVATQSMLQRELARTQRQSAAALQRSRAYGGAE